MLAKFGKIASILSFMPGERCTSTAACNGKTGLTLCCPMTTQIKGYPFDVRIAADSDSAVRADQVRSRDWRAGCDSRTPLHASAA